MSVDGEKIVRISDEKASKLYSEGFRFIPKSEWKEKVRDVNKPEPTKEEPTETKNNKVSRASKRHAKKKSRNK